MASFFLRFIVMPPQEATNLRYYLLLGAFFKLKRNLQNSNFSFAIKKVVKSRFQI